MTMSWEWIVFIVGVIWALVFLSNIPLLDLLFANNWSKWEIVGHSIKDQKSRIVMTRINEKSGRIQTKTITIEGGVLSNEAYERIKQLHEENN